jgi:hypothetical protein
MRCKKGSGSIEDLCSPPGDLVIDRPWGGEGRGWLASLLSKLNPFPHFVIRGGVEYSLLLDESLVSAARHLHVAATECHPMAKCRA